ncbi:MAG: DinB family protein [Chloroflexi bacterium]|nr:DinB family protein [Chloroflexota bacterium]
MAEMNQLAHFMYGRGFWYATPEREIGGLTDEQLLWAPTPNNLPILWHVGHIAHRERTHIGLFLQGLSPPIIPPEHEVFGVEWRPIEQLRRSVRSVQAVLEWVREVREQSHLFIDSLTDADYQRVPPTSAEGLSVAHWLFITTAHTAVHIGRIQLLRAMILGKHESAC